MATKQKAEPELSPEAQQALKDKEAKEAKEKT